MTKVVCCVASKSADSTERAGVPMGPVKITAELMYLRSWVRDPPHHGEMYLSEL